MNITPLHSFFKKKILNFTRPRNNNVFNFSHSKGLIFIICLHAGLSNLGGHKFKHSFLNTFNLLVFAVFILKQ